MFTLFCSRFINWDKRYLDDTLVIFFLLFPRIITMKYFEVIGVSGTYPCGQNQRQYKIEFNSKSRVYKVNFNIQETSNYIEVIKQFLF
jgi:hypothetical protein